MPQNILELSINDTIPEIPNPVDMPENIMKFNRVYQINVRVKAPSVPPFEFGKKVWRIQFTTIKNIEEGQYPGHSGKAADFVYEDSSGDLHVYYVPWSHGTLSTMFLVTS